MDHIISELCYKGTILQWNYSEVIIPSSVYPKGGQGVRTPPPPGKSLVIWVSIGNKQLDPPPPWKKLDPLWNLVIDFIEIDHLTSVK